MDVDYMSYPLQKRIDLDEVPFKDIPLMHMLNNEDNEEKYKPDRYRDYKKQGPPATKKKARKYHQKDNHDRKKTSHTTRRSLQMYLHKFFGIFIRH